MTIPHLSAADLDALALTPLAMRDALADTLRAQATGHVHTAPKSMLKPADGRLLMTTLSADDTTGIMAVKALVQNPANRGPGATYIDGTVTAFDAFTGRPLATLDGPWITAQRTAALSMLAAQHLANPQAQTAAFLGAGVQASSHLAALTALYPLKSIRIFSRSAPTRLTEQARSLNLAVAIADTARSALSGADIVISAVSRDAPATPVDPAWLAPGAFAALVDLGHGWPRDALATLDALYIDDLAQERVMPTDTRLADLDAVAGDLMALVTGAAPARQTPDQRIAFLSRGPAASDLSLVALALQQAGLAP